MSTVSARRHRPIHHIIDRAARHISCVDWHAVAMQMADAIADQRHPAVRIWRAADDAHDVVDLPGGGSVTIPRRDG